MPELMLLFGLASMTVLAVLTSIVTIPRAHFGVVQRFGRRTGRILPEGINIVLPFGIERTELISTELRTTPVTVRFFGKDNIEAVLTGSLQWRASPSITDEYGRNRFVEMSEETVADGITDAVESVCANLSGNETVETFIGERQAVEDCVNCAVRLPVPPHEERRLEPAAWIAFYAREGVAFRRLLEKGGERRFRDASPLEHRYGIEVAAFAITNITWSDATKQALEKKRQTLASLEAVDEQARRAEGIAKRLREEQGLEPETAMNTARILLGLAENKIITIEGLSKSALADIVRGLKP